MQNQFLKYLKERHNQPTSFIDEIASVLDIGYDAAYRRINLKTNLSLEEGVKLAKHFNISLNKLFEVGSQNTLVVEKSPHISNIKNLEAYFDRSIKKISHNITSFRMFYF